MAFDAFSTASSRESSPLSSPPSSPCPPSDYSYPSPPPSQDPSTKGSPLPDTMEPARACEDDGPPRKKRRTTEPKPRVTRHLDLQDDVIEESQREALDLLLKVLHKKRKIVMIVGAGISVAAGIPDFRSSKGLFNSLKQQHNLKSSGKDLFDVSVYRDPATTATFHEMVRSLSHQAKSAKPTAFHHLIATLADEGRLLRLYSQNVDGIETSLEPLATQVPLPQKAPWPKTVLLHGGLEKMVCVKCNDVRDFDPEIFDGPIPPACIVCKEADEVRTLHAGKRSHGIGKLRPRMVLYNENGPDEEAIGSVTTADLRSRPDAVIVVGTTLKVPGVRRIVREMVNTVRDRKDGFTVWVNNEPEPKGQDLENCWDLVVRGPCDAVARQAALRIWNDRSEPKILTEEEYQAAKAKPSPEVRIPASPRKNNLVDRAKGIMTPSASPRLRPLDDSMGDEIVVATKPLTPSKRGTAQNKGKNLTDVLAERPKPKARNAKTAPKKKAAPKKKSNVAPATAKTNEKITSAFTASKPATQTISETKTKTRPQRRGRKATDSTNGPMAPVSPQSAKNNTAPPHADPLKVVPGLDTKLIKEEMNTGESAEVLKRRESRSGTISPTGHVPADMKFLLH